MKVAIIGSRDYPDLAQVDALVALLPPETVVVSGGAAGVDQHAEAAARQRGLPAPIVVRPDPTLIKERGWAFALKARNRTIVAMADRIWIFWDENSPGSANACAHAVMLEKSVRIIVPGKVVVSLW